MLSTIKPCPEKFGETIYSVEVPSAMSRKNDVLDSILSALNGVQLLDDEMGIRLALDEAISNCIIHGNKRKKTKKIRIEVFYEGKKWGVIFEDEGEGFIPKVVPDFNDPETLLAEGGRGIFLMHHYMDEVFYCGRGNVLQLNRKSKKRRSRKKSDE